MLYVSIGREKASSIKYLQLSPIYLFERKYKRIISGAFPVWNIYAWTCNFCKEKQVVICATNKTMWNLRNETCIKIKNENLKWKEKKNNTTRTGSKKFKAQELWQRKKVEAKTKGNEVEPGLIRQTYCIWLDLTQSKWQATDGPIVLIRKGGTEEKKTNKAWITKHITAIEIRRRILT